MADNSLRKQKHLVFLSRFTSYIQIVQLALRILISVRVIKDKIQTPLQDLISKY
jgi:hypothetical protein